MKIHLSFIILFFNALIVYSQNWSSQADSIDNILDMQSKTELNQADTIFLNSMTKDNCMAIDSFFKNTKYSGVYKSYLTSIIIEQNICVSTVISNLNYFQWSNKADRINDSYNYPISYAIHKDSQLKDKIYENIFNSDFLSNCEILNSISDENLIYLAYLFKSKITSEKEKIKYTKCKKGNLDKLIEKIEDK